MTALRVVAVPVFDPVYYDTGKRNGRDTDLKAVNYRGFFIEGLSGGDVLGRITPISGLMKGSGAGPALEGDWRSAPCIFRQLLPETWVFRDEHPDYGIDGEVEVFEVEVFDDAGNPTGRQSKKSVSYLSRLSPA